MNVDETTGARVAMWWTRAITRTAEPDTALDRQAEIVSDVHDQLTAACDRGGLRAGSRSVVARVLRGVPSDIAWRVGLELRPGRLAWHLRNPSTAITTLLVLMIPLNVAADQALVRSSLLDLRVLLWTATDLVGVCIALLAVLALVSRIWPRWTSRVDRFQPRSRLERARRCATAALGVALAGSALLRFTPFSLIGGAFWGLFAASLIVYLALVVATISAKVLDLGKLSS